MYITLQYPTIPTISNTLPYNTLHYTFLTTIHFKTQLEINLKTKSITPTPRYADYTDIGGDMELPLGAEFQQHLACFVQKNKPPEKQYELAAKLVKQLE